jgi:hypothetical protein
MIEVDWNRIGNDEEFERSCGAPVAHGVLEEANVACEPRVAPTQPGRAMQEATTRRR